MSITSETLLDALHWRYATKVFDPARQIPEKEWKALEQALVLSPSSMGLQPYRFLVVQNPDLRARLREVSWNQSQVTDASHLVVLVARRDTTTSDIEAFVERAAEVRGLTPADLKGYRDMMVATIVEGPRSAHQSEWAARQTYIAFGQVMAAAGLLGIDACPLEGLDPVAYDRILGLEGGRYQTLAACVFGYRSEDDKYAHLPKVRLPEDELIHYC